LSHPTTPNGYRRLEVPTYDYKCEPCEKMVRVLKPMSRAAVAENCPQCKGRMKRIYMPAYVKANNTPKFHGR
jgi:putative FmdB family regulatory protein